MKNWQEFQKAEPILLEIESRFERLQKFESRYLSSQEEHGYQSRDVEAARDAIMESIRAEAAHINGKVYYWLYPFYRGNFLKLVAALGACGLMEKQKDDEISRTAFYSFFRTVPFEERLQLGERLNQPELTEQAHRIRNKIKAKRSAVQDFLNQNHAN